MLTEKEKYPHYSGANRRSRRADKQNISANQNQRKIKRLLTPAAKQKKKIENQGADNSNVHSGNCGQMARAGHARRLAQRLARPPFFDSDALLAQQYFDSRTQRGFAERQTGKTGVAQPGSDKKAGAVPVPQPVRRPAPEAEGDSGRNQVEQGVGQGRAIRQLAGFQVPGAAPPGIAAAEPAAVPPQDLPGTALPEGQLTGGDGVAPPGFDTLPAAIGSAAGGNSPA